MANDDKTRHAITCYQLAADGRVVYRDYSRFVSEYYSKVFQRLISDKCIFEEYTRMYDEDKICKIRSSDPCCDYKCICFYVDGCLRVVE